ncbi:MAG: CAP domain-containing protein [Solirubrobacteraceae bacterium]
MSDSDTAVLCLGEARAWTAARRIATMVAMLVASLSFASVAAARTRGCAAAHRSIARASRDQLQRAVVCLINRQRRGRGLPGLRENSRLNRSAQGWTNVMVTHRDFSHGADFAARISAVGFDWSNVGENIATGFSTPTAVVRAWMASKGHCQNILNPVYRYVGTGVSDDSISGYSTLAGTWTQDFGLLMGQHAASGNWGPAEGCPYHS